MQRRLLDLTELGNRLATIDLMIMRLALRRMHIAQQVGRYKQSRKEPFVRLDIEDQRIIRVREWAVAHGLNQHFAESLLYLLINESCKRQLYDLQAHVIGAIELENDDERYTQLKRNLLLLTERWCLSYDSSYDATHIATHLYIEYEREAITREIAQLADTELMLDLGSATGRASFQHYDHFNRVVGYDLSQHMQTHANQLAEERGVQSRVSFECADLEEGIPAPDSCASFVLMNLGTAGDVRDIKRVIAETVRVLKPGGRLLFSFYNREALVYRWELLPWPIGMAAAVNIYSDSLEVHCTNDSRDEIIPVYARAYTVSEVQELFAEYGIEVATTTHPTVSAILPEGIFDGQPEVQKSIKSIDLALVGQSMGAYIIATGSKGPRQHPV